MSAQHTPTREMMERTGAREQHAVIAALLAQNADLLAALQSVIDQTLSGLREPFDKAQAATALMDCMDIARAAIAKAQP